MHLHWKIYLFGSQEKADSLRGKGREDIGLGMDGILELVEILPTASLDIIQQPNDDLNGSMAADQSTTHSMSDRQSQAHSTH